MTSSTTTASPMSLRRASPGAVRWPASRWLAAVVALAVAAVLVSAEHRRVFLSGAGIAQGALIAAVALGVVLTFRGSGVVNLANGTVAMYAAYVYAVLRADGDLFLPPFPLLPDAISFGPNMQFWPALLLALGVCVVLGLALHYVVFRPLRNAPPLAKAIASVGVFLLLQAIVVKRFGATPRSVRAMSFVDKSRVELGPAVLSQEQLFVAVLVIVVATALWALFRFTRFGLATRAAAENERGAIVLGYSPDLLAGLNWVLSTTITGLLGIFVASINSNVDPVVIPALVVPALTAALAGGFRSFGVTTLAAFLLGMQLPLVQYLGVSAEWFPQAAGQPLPGVDTLVPLVLIVALLYLRGNALPGRGTVAARLPLAPEPGRVSLLLVGPATIALTLVAALFWLGPTYRGALANSLIATVLCVSVVVVTGYVGQLALAPMAFAGIGAFVVADLTTDRGWPFPVPIAVAAVAAAGIGLVVAVPALRIRGVNLAIVTLAFGVAMDRFVFDNPNVNGGLNGAPVASPGWVDQRNTNSFRLFGAISVGDGKQPGALSTVFCLIVAATACYAVAALRRSKVGRELIAVRANERASAAAGVGVARAKALAFTTSAAIAGVAGAVIAYRSGGVAQNRFTYEQSLLVFAFAYVGGIARVSGAVVGGLLTSGGLVFVGLKEWFGLDPAYAHLLGGIGLIVTLIAHPDGIAATQPRRRRPPADPARQPAEAAP